VIPEFDENGYLPPGVHRATSIEVQARFGTSTEIRRVQMESLRWMLDLVAQASIARVIINGSWVTDEPEPIDIDCVLLAGPDWGTKPDVEQELLDGLPFLSPQIANQTVFDRYVNVIFASDRSERPKGVVEVVQ